MALVSPHVRGDQQRPRTWAWWLGLALLLGAALRLVGIGQLSISHYDEGVYALSAQGLAYPGGEYFAPPLFPLALRPVALLWPWQDTPLFLVNAFLGVVGIALAALVAVGVSRCAALIAAALVACSGWHVVYSRSVLTDVLFADCVLLSVAATARLLAAETSDAGAQRWRWAAVLGVALLGAWYTKYATPVLVAGILSGTVAVLAASGSEWRCRVTGGLLVFLAVAVSFAGYIPWVAHVQRTIGYENLLTHHRGYVLGWSAWFSNIREYARYARALLPQLSAVGVGVVLVASLTGGLCRNTPAISRLLCLLAFGAAGMLAGDVVWPVVGLMGSGIGRPRGRLAFPTFGVTTGVLACFFFVTPLYRPYPRLAIPTILLGCVAIAVLLDGVLTRSRGHKIAVTAGTMSSVAALAIFGVVELSPPPEISNPPQGAAPLEEAVRELAAAASGEHTVYVYARPCVTFYLVPRMAVQLLGEPSAVRQALRTAAPLIVDTALLLDNPPVAELFERDSCQPAGIWPYCPSLPTRLNDWHHRRLPVAGDWPYWLWLFREDGGAAAQLYGP